MNRIVLEYEGLKSYFLSKNFRDALKRFVKPRVISQARDIKAASVGASEHQLPDEEIFVGYATNQLLRLLERQGDITANHRKHLISGVRMFYNAATEYVFLVFHLKTVLFSMQSGRSSGKEET